MFFGPRKKLPGMAPNRAGRFFFRLIQTLPTFWAERILILRILIFWIFWKPLTADYVAAGNFFVLQKNGPHIYGSPELVGTLPQAFFFSRKMAPRFPDVAGAGRTLRSQPDPSPNAPRDQIRRKDPCCDKVFGHLFLLFLKLAQIHKR